MTLKDMSDTSEYIEFRDDALRRLAGMQEAHQKAWRFGSEDSWHFDQSDGTLVFSFDDGTSATCSAQIIGTFNQQDGTWLLGSSNDSIPNEVTQGARNLQIFGQENGYDRLTEESWKGTEDDAWGVTAISAKVNGCQGVYRGPAGTTMVFFTFKDVRLAHE